MDFIEIEGYKTIKKARIELKPINILIGANGSGKSNFLSFFEFLNRLYERKLQQYVFSSGGTEKIYHKGRKLTEEIKASIGFNTFSYHFSISGVNTIGFKLEEVHENNQIILKLESGDTESQLKINSFRTIGNIKKYLAAIKKYHFQDTSLNSAFYKYSNLDKDIHYLYDKGDNLAAFLFNLLEKEEKYYNRILKTIQSVAPYFSDFYLHPNADNNLNLLWTDKFSSLLYNVNDLSDGTIRFIALTVLFMQPNLPECIIIDEPELGLHPFAIAKLAGMIKSAASRDCQVIVATQSTELISHFEPEDIITVDQIDGESQFNRLNSESLAIWLEDYTIDDLWKRSIIKGGQPN